MLSNCSCEPSRVTAAVENDDTIGLDHCRQAMRMVNTVVRPTQLCTVAQIASSLASGAGGFIKRNNRGCWWRQCEPLPLPARLGPPAFAMRVAHRPRSIDERERTGAASASSPLRCRRLATVTQVVEHTAGEQHRILRHESDLASHVARSAAADRHRR